MPLTGRADPYIQFVLPHMDNETQEMLTLEDVHILHWQGTWACFNYS